MSFVLLAGEIENLMKMNRRMKQEQEKHAAEMKEEENRQMQMKCRHEKEEKNEYERLQAKREEQREKHQRTLDEIRDLRHRNEICIQQVSCVSATRRGA